MGFHYAGCGIKAHVPDLLQQHRARGQTSRAAHEVLQKFEFFRHQLNRLALPVTLAEEVVSFTKLINKVDR